MGLCHCVLIIIITNCVCKSGKVALIMNECVCTVIIELEWESHHSRFQYVKYICMLKITEKTLFTVDKEGLIITF